MKRTAVALALLAALTLTGCAGAIATTPDEPQDAATTSVEQAPEPSETPDDLVASDPAEMTDAETEAAYLLAVRDRLSKIRTQIPDATDAQLIDAAYRACERIESGVSSEGQSLIEGEEMTNGYYMDSDAIAIAARLTVCPTEG